MLNATLSHKLPIFCLQSQNVASQKKQGEVNESEISRKAHPLKSEVTMIEVIKDTPMIQMEIYFLFRNRNDLVEECLSMSIPKILLGLYLQLNHRPIVTWIS